MRVYNVCKTVIFVRRAERFKHVTFAACSLPDYQSILLFGYVALGVWEGLRFVIVALPGLFSYPFYIIPNFVQTNSMEDSKMSKISHNQRL